MTTPVTNQGPAMQGMSQQRGYTPGFPPPFGLEQYLGQPQYGGFPQQYGGLLQQPYSQSQFPGQQQATGMQVQTQQIIQSLVSQLLPIAQQVILPQVVATAAQQIPVHLYQLVAQQLTSQLGQQGSWQQGSWQQPHAGQQGWQQPQFGQQGQFGNAFPGIS